jgi:Tfp pilus assembly protein PilN
VRPVNLIPPEDRRGERAPARTGAIPYFVLGILGLAVVAVAVLALTNKQISDREAEKTSLEAQQAQAQARAEALAPYAEFVQASEAQTTTVTSLAQSRFDWVRVLKELSLVLPGDIWLTGLSGSTSGSEAGSDSAGGLAVPTLSIKGCGTGHRAVAAFVQTLHDIDGVTRVGVASSVRGSESGGASGGASGGTGDGSCQTRDFIATFEISVAFDAATAPTAATTVPPDPAAGAVEPEGQVADAQQQEQQARDSAAEQSDKAGNAAEIIPGVTR